MLKTRIVLLFTIFFVAWFSLVFKAAQIQILPHEKLSQLQKKQFKKTVTLKPRRGSIVDRFEKEVAVSIPSYSLFADPKLIDKPDQVARNLAKYISLSRTDIYKKIKNKSRRFVWLQRQMRASKMEEIKNLKVRGLSFIEEPQRVYPNSQSLSQFLGFVGREDEGLEGVELSLNKYLRGNDKNLRLRKDARGRPLLVDGRVFAEAQEGYQVQLTVDSELQYVVERELIKTVEHFEAESAMAVVIDVKTSEVLAIANVPTYDPNMPGRYDRKLWRNRVATDVIEPGSTMKTFTLAAALAEKVVQPNTKINCENGKFKVGRYFISEADSKHHFETLSVTEILANSSNIGTTKVAFKLGDDKLRSYLEKFGFGQKLEMSLPGEVAGTLQPLPWRPHLLANISFGHGIAVTPLQMAAAYVAIANGGILRSPRFIKKISNSEEEVDVDDFFQGSERRIFSPQLSETLRFMLTASAAPTARVAGFPTAGKTGTAQKINPNGRGYKKGAYLASYAGFIPANDPRFMIYVIVDEPKGFRYYGSEVAAPVFSSIAQFAVNKYRLAPVTLKVTNLLTQKDSQSKVVGTEGINGINRSISAHLMPDLKGLSLRQALQVLKRNGNSVDIQGSGRVIDSVPKSGEALSQESKVKVFLQSTKM